MSSEENYVVSDVEIDKKRIEDIDLAELARSFRVLDRFFSADDIAAPHKGDEEESPDTSIKMRLIDFLMCNKHYYVERQIAFRMMYASISGAPQYLAEIERVLGLRLTSIEDE